MKITTNRMGAVILFLSLVGGVIYLLSDPDQWIEFYHAATDKEKLKFFLSSFGAAAPMMFILLQIVQVIAAPFPGEISGFVGGYLFGTLQGFLLSSIGLTIGSWINFLIGRFMGHRFVRKRIPVRKLERFDHILKRQGVVVILMLFIFPGFPKDYLCLFLGLSNLPLKLFLVLSSVGRMPGTLMLSLQGAALFDQMYGLFAGTLVFCLLVLALAYRYRSILYVWAERLEGR